jgi:hypothetical protein
MTSEDLDRKMRQILLDANPATSLSSVKALMELGFSIKASLFVVLDVLKAKEEGRYPHEVK